MTDQLFAVPTPDLATAVEGVWYAQVEEEPFNPATNTVYEFRAGVVLRGEKREPVGSFSVDGDNAINVLIDDEEQRANRVPPYLIRLTRVIGDNASRPDAMQAIYSEPDGDDEDVTTYGTFIRANAVLN